MNRKMIYWHLNLTAKHWMMLLLLINYYELLGFLATGNALDSHFIKLYFICKIRRNARFNFKSVHMEIKKKCNFEATFSVRN